MRDKVEAVADATCGRLEAEVVLEMRDGRRVSATTTSPLGSLANPMSDTALSAKFCSLAEPVLGATRTARLLERSWGLAEESDLAWIAADA